jgi:hypothetical protein
LFSEILLLHNGRRTEWHQAATSNLYALAEQKMVLHLMTLIFILNGLQDSIGQIPRIEGEDTTVFAGAALELRGTFQGFDLKYYQRALEAKTGPDRGVAACSTARRGVPFPVGRL